MLVLPAAAGAQRSGGGEPAGWAEFTRLLQAYADSDQVVGASALLLRDGQVVGRWQTGFADREAGVETSEQTIYHWGSITKTLTAIAIMQLRDRGRLSLDDRIVRWVPELRQVHDPYGMVDSITIRMLLSHSAGFMNSTWPYDEGHAWEPFEPTTWQQLVAMMPYQQLHFRPGSRYGYSNPGFIYLARVIEQLTGDPWDAYIHKNIFAPLGLHRSYFRDTPYHLAPLRAHNYYVQRDSAGGTRLVDNGADFDPGITTPNGGWNAPLSDLAAYTAFLTDAVVVGGSRAHYATVLSRSTLEEMWRPMVPMAEGYEAGADQHMGLSFFLIGRGGDSAASGSRPEAARPAPQAPARRGDRQLVGHTGSQAGFRAFFYFDPVRRTGVIAAFNTTNVSAPAAALYQRVQQAALALL